MIEIQYEGSEYYICEVCHRLIIFVDSEMVCDCNTKVVINCDQLSGKIDMQG